MQQLKIPQSPFVTSNGMVAPEWLVFLNEFVRLSNTVINSETIKKANNAEFNSVEKPTFVGFDVSAANSQDVTEVALVTPTDDVIPLTPIYAKEHQSVDVDNVPLQTTYTEQVNDSPYAQLATTLQLLHNQQIWSLNV